MKWFTPDTGMLISKPAIGMTHFPISIVYNIYIFIQYMGMSQNVRPGGPQILVYF